MQSDYLNNISSENVRRALLVLEGIREGQQLGTLLGYQFESYLHNHNLDQYISDFRIAFNLDQLPIEEENSISKEHTESSREEELVIESEASSDLKQDIDVAPPLVVNGQKLIECKEAPEVLKEIWMNQEVQKGIRYLKETMDTITDILVSADLHSLIDKKDIDIFWNQINEESTGHNNVSK